MALKNLALAALVSVMGVLSASCWFSSPSASASAATAVRDASAKAREASSVYIEYEVSLEGADPANFPPTRVHGGVDAESRTSFFILSGEGPQAEMRSIGGKTFTRVGDGKWYESKENEIDESFYQMFESGFDPLDLLEDSGANKDRIKHQGSGEVRGQTAQRYSALVPTSDVNRDMVDRSFRRGDELLIEVWVGADGLPCRIVLESVLPAEQFDIESEDDVTLRFEMDLFDYGKPVDVEAPPADQIAEAPSFGDILGGAYEDPFEGAACYGERVAECLAVNPEAEAMAQDPGLCQHWDVRVCLVPMGFVRADVLKAVVDFHKTTKNIDVVVLPGIPIPAGVLDVENSQLPTAKLDELMKATYITTGTASTFIGISGIDQQGESFGWWFGHRFGRSAFSNQHGMFSYFRMANVAPYSGEPITDELLHLRVSKYAARYTALLLLDYPATDDPDYLNYHEMYGFSDLDSMGTKWPEGHPPCLGLERTVCVVPDGRYTDPAFEEDVISAAARVTRETGIRVEVRADSLSLAFEPSKPDWGAEYVHDISTYIRGWYHYPQFPIVGVTDDALSRDASVPVRIDQAHPLLSLSVVSGHGAGRPGTPEHQERMYRLVLRGVLVAHFQMELSDDPESLMYRGITAPEQLDGKVIPAIPR